ncbi:MAG: methyltransferase domain-containing protein [Zoogloeaceae bacterium]|jgi:malonyl-CoA O-methyltransferase|nr:methyltransferase domain-containing protein [Zoogloeaceae bacterium]
MPSDFSRAAASYDEVAVLAREVGQRMLARLDFVKLAPARFADIGCATGDGARMLQARYPYALPLALDLAPAMLAEVARRASWMTRLRRRALRCVAADARRLPLADGALGLVWSNLMLHWLDDPLPAFRELERVLEIGGLLTFSALGPDTLRELRAAGAATLRRFHDMHDLGDMLMTAGFADPVMDAERIELTYASPRGLLRDQRLLGARDGLLGALGFRAGRRVFRAWARRDGRLPATFEIIYGHAWKAAPKTAADGRAIVRFKK